MPRTPRWIRVGCSLLLAAAALVVSPLATSPAAAYESSADTAAADFPVLASDGTVLKARVLYPTATPPQGGWPMVLVLHGYGGSRCLGYMSVGSAKVYTRKMLAEEGYVAVSFDGRGSPAVGQIAVDVIDEGATGCDQVSNAIEGLDDSGHDLAGAVDQQDMKDVITAAINGCNGLCTGKVNENKIGAMGYSYGGMRTWAIGLPPAYGGDSRVKAVIPGAGFYQTNIPSSVSNYPTDQSYNYPNILSSNMGSHLRSDRMLTPNVAEWTKGQYLDPGTPICCSNSNGSMSLSGTTVTISGSPSFKKSDVGQQIEIDDAALVDGTDDGTSNATEETLLATITGYTSSTQVTVGTAARGSGSTISGKTVRWGAQAFMDARTVVSGGSSPYDMVDKAHLYETPIFSHFGWLDGLNSGTLPIIEAWKRIPAGNKKFLYLGSCGHAGNEGQPCGAVDADKLHDKIKLFLDRYVDGQSVQVVSDQTNATGQTYSGADNKKLTISADSAPRFVAADDGKPISIVGAGPGGGTLDTTIDAVVSDTEVTLTDAASSPGTNRNTTWKPCAPDGPCVMYQIPRGYASSTDNPFVGTNSDNWPWQEYSAFPMPELSWSPYTEYLHWNKTDGGCSANTGCLHPDVPAGSETASKSMSETGVTPHLVDYCTSALDTTSNALVYTDPAAADADYKLFKVDLNLVLSSSTSRMQVVADLYDVYEVAGVEVEKRISQKSAVNVPVVRTGYTAGSKITLSFQPFDSAWTVLEGHKLRLRISPNFPKHFFREPWPSTYTLYHNPSQSSERSSVTFHFAA